MRVASSTPATLPRGPPSRSRCRSRSTCPPQLLVIALAQTALAASHRALESAHPILGTTPRQTSFPAVTDCEHFAILVMHAASQLAELLSEYSAAVIQENIDSDDDSPF